MPTQKLRSPFFPCFLNKFWSRFFGHSDGYIWQRTPSRGQCVFGCYRLYRNLSWKLCSSIPVGRIKCRPYRSILSQGWCIELIMMATWIQFIAGYLSPIILILWVYVTATHILRSLSTYIYNKHLTLEPYICNWKKWDIPSPDKSRLLRYDVPCYRSVPFFWL